MTLIRPTLFLLTAGLAACAAPERVGEPETQVWGDRQAVIGVAFAPTPIPGLYAEGTPTARHKAAAPEVEAALEQHLAAFDVSSFRRLRDSLVATLIARGVQAQRLPPVDPAAYPPLAVPVTPGNYVAEDFSALKAQGVDRLLLLNLAQAGAVRTYYGFMTSVSAPKGYAVAEGRLIDLSTGRLLWSFETLQKTVVDGEWSTPPDFTALNNAIRAALQNAIRELDGDLMLSLAGLLAPATTTPPASTEFPQSATDELEEQAENMAAEESAPAVAPSAEDRGPAINTVALDTGTAMPELTLDAPVSIRRSGQRGPALKRAVAVSVPVRHQTGTSPALPPPVQAAPPLAPAIVATPPSAAKVLQTTGLLRRPLAGETAFAEIAAGSQVQIVSRTQNSAGQWCYVVSVRGRGWVPAAALDAN